MTRGELLYRDIHLAGKEKIEEIASGIIEKFEEEYYPVDIGGKINAINKVYALIAHGYYDKVKTWLGEVGYKAEAEIQHIITNFGYSYVLQGNNVYTKMSRFSSLETFTKYPECYVLNTCLGEVTVWPLHLIKNRNISQFAWENNWVDQSHQATCHFLRANPMYSAVTSLIVEQFGMEQYHSYIPTKAGYIDFANNVLWKAKEFDRIMNPCILDAVSGHELEKRANKLTEEDLSSEYNLLLRLAVNKQLKKSK